MIPNPEDYPHLFAPLEWGIVRAEFIPGETPPTALIGNVNLVPRVEDRWLVLTLADGTPEIPGGTLEPGESYMETLRRELREEAGARPLDFTPLGAFRCESSAAKPYRPHLPHPLFYRLVGVGRVVVDGVPSNPAGAEQVARVELLPLDEAVARFNAAHRPELGDLYRYAAAEGQ